MSIITVLAAMAMTVHRNSIILGREAVLREDLFRMRDAIDQYYADKGKYPADLQALVSDGYLRAVPNDPFTDSRGDVADDSRRARSEQSLRRTGRVQRQERFGQVLAPGHAL